MECMNKIVFIRLYNFYCLKKILKELCYYDNTISIYLLYVITLQCALNTTACAIHEQVVV